MNFIYRVSTVVLSLTTLIIFQPKTMAASATKTLEKIAKEITVGILNSEKKDQPPQDTISGSGVIFAKSDNTYYVLTAQHVVDSDLNYKIAAPDGSLYPLNCDSSTSCNLLQEKGIDLAVLRFNSNKFYKVATLSTICVAENWNGAKSGQNTADRIDINSTKAFKGFCKPADLSFNNNVQNRPLILLAGYPSENNKKRNLEITWGLLLDRNYASNLVKGSSGGAYDFVYTNETKEGMSGGPILDTSGHVIGIHAATDAIIGIKDRVKFGYSLGIPIDKFFERIKKVFPDNLLKMQNLQIAGDSFPPQEVSRRDISSFSIEPAFVCSSNTAIDETKLLDYGNKLYRFGYYSEAIDCYKRVIQVNPQSPVGWYATGVLLVQHFGKTEEGLKFLEEATKVSPNYSRAWYEKCVVFNTLKRYNDAFISCEQALKSDKSGVFYKALFERGRALEGLNKRQEALESYRNYSKISSEQTAYTPSVKQANIALILQNYQEALQRYKLAIENNEANPEAWIGKGRVLIRLGHYDEAVDALNKAVEIMQSSHFKTWDEGWLETLSQGWFELGRQREQPGLTQQIGLFYKTSANEFYRVAIKANKNNEKAWLYQGILQQKSGQYTNAMDSYNQAIEINHNFQLALTQKAILERILQEIQSLKHKCQKRLSRATTFVFSASVGWDVSFHSTPSSQSELSAPIISENPLTTHEEKFFSVLVGRVRVDSGSSAFCTTKGELVGLQLKGELVAPQLVQN